MTTGKTVLTSTAGWGTPRQSRRLRRRAIAWHSDKLTAPTRASTTNSLMVSDEAHQELAALPQLEGQEDCFAVFKAIQHVRNTQALVDYNSGSTAPSREDKFMGIWPSITVSQLCVQRKRTRTHPPLSGEATCKRDPGEAQRKCTRTPASGIPVQAKHAKAVDPETATTKKISQHHHHPLQLHLLGRSVGVLRKESSSSRGSVLDDRRRTPRPWTPRRPRPRRSLNITITPWNSTCSADRWEF
mmetsp:Transcript_70435/g.141860  ORF Transcript_70435/g.141860 Transcript_70435/m.141860 type:complete len:243 (+) Transcript_70435:1153-1881(+)